MSNAGESGIYNKYDGQNKQDANTKSSDSNMNNEMFFKDKGGNMGASNSGGSLQYIDDKSSSYSSIFDNAVGKSEEADYQRVIMALKALSTGTDLEKHFDVDAILKYLAAHTIVVNLDSYSSSMAQNYYIYEKDGKITILPWDYNLAWGGFQSSDAASVINFPIDTPVSGVEMADRPLLEKLFANSNI
nr:CotH kinase family protein [Desulforamulus aquiferis]